MRYRKPALQRSCSRCCFERGIHFCNTVICETERATIDSLYRQRAYSPLWIERIRRPHRAGEWLIAGDAGGR